MKKKLQYKYQIAELCGVSMTTFRFWLNTKYFDKLKEIGYHKNQKYLTFPQIVLLNSILDFLE